MKLAERLTKAEAVSAEPLFRRSQMALLAVVRAAQGRDADAAALLAKLTAAVGAMKIDVPGPDRWPDLVAMTGTLGRPALSTAVAELARAMNKPLDDALGRNILVEDREWWVRVCRAARTKAMINGLESGIKGPGPEGKNQDEGRSAPPRDFGFAHWDSAPGLTAASRSQGWDRPLWMFRDGVLSHRPGHAEDYLILRTPFRGDFEVNCGLKLSAWQDAYVRYGAYEFFLIFDRKKYRIFSSVRTNGRDAVRFGSGRPAPAGSWPTSRTGTPRQSRAWRSPRPAGRSRPPQPTDQSASGRPRCRAYLLPTRLPAGPVGPAWPPFRPTANGSRPSAKSTSS